MGKVAKNRRLNLTASVSVKRLRAGVSNWFCATAFGNLRAV